jgi:hypothetical protein
VEVITLIAGMSDLLNQSLGPAVRLTTQLAAGLHHALADPDQSPLWAHSFRRQVPERRETLIAPITRDPYENCGLGPSHTPNACGVAPAHQLALEKCHPFGA